VLADSTATVMIDGTPLTAGSPSEPIGLSMGANTITLVITGQDRTTTKTYTVTVKRFYEVFLPFVIR